jgi:hypothetical protein
MIPWHSSSGIVQRNLYDVKKVLAKEGAKAMLARAAAIALRDVYP